MSNTKELFYSKNVRKFMIHQMVDEMHLRYSKKKKYYTATDLVNFPELKELGYSARALNKKLEEAGLQVKNLDGDNEKRWDLTDSGDVYGLYVTWDNPNGTSIRTIRWEIPVLKLLNL